jgi:hypothetical protein
VTTLAGLAWLGGGYLVVAAAVSWLLVCYEHMGQSGWRSAWSKRPSEVGRLLLMSLGWLPLLAVLAFNRTPRR